jgi:hypothetical protein
MDFPGHITKPLHGHLQCGTGPTWIGRFNTGPTSSGRGIGTITYSLRGIGRTRIGSAHITEEIEKGQCGIGPMWNGRFDTGPTGSSLRGIGQTRIGSVGPTGRSGTGGIGRTRTGRPTAIAEVPPVIKVRSSDDEIISKGL